MSSMHLIKSSRGFTVVEIMIALVLGLILSAGVTNVYLTTKQNYLVSENLGRMQESARFAMAELQQNIRMAGFLPCRLTGNEGNTLRLGGDTFYDFFNASMRGFDGGDPASFPTEFPAVGTAPGDRVAGADGIVVLRGGDETYVVTQHNPTSARFAVNDLHTLEDAEILLVCDGTTAAIFQATNVEDPNTNIVHNTGNETPGNCSKSLGGGGDCSDLSSFEEHEFGPDSQLVKFIAMGYYIGVSTSGDSRSLYRIGMNVTGSVVSFQPQELVKNIENMQLLYGEDTDDDNEVEQYVTADLVTVWNNVLNVRIGILAQTPDEVNSEADSKVYNLAGTLIGPTTTVAHDGDERIRYAFGSTIKVRNRGID